MPPSKTTTRSRVAAMKSRLAIARRGYRGATARTVRVQVCARGKFPMPAGAGRSCPGSGQCGNILDADLPRVLRTSCSFDGQNPRTTASAPEGRREGRNRDETHQDVRPRRRGGGRRDGVRRGLFGDGGKTDGYLQS